MFHREKVEKEFKPLYSKIGLGTTIWSPLKFGILSGKYDQNEIHTESRAASYSQLNNLIQSPEGKSMIESTKKLKSIADQLDWY
jgi:aryl-alcohol dehydrogenase-like predicted oxidoreductase